MKHNGYAGTLTMDLNRLLKVFPGIALTWVCFLVAACCVRLTEARIGYFWHITDIHLDTYYTTKGDIFRSCWLTEHHSNTANAKRPGPYGDYMCDSPWSLLESATQAMKSKQGDNVEFVLWTGDGLSHSAKRMHDTKRLDVLRNITELMSRTFPSQFVFPVLGHEDGSANYEQLGDLWRHWLPLEALQTFEKGGYYTIEQTKSRLRIIALNTNYMRHDPKYSQSHSSAVKQRPDGSYHYPIGTGGGHYGGDHHSLGKHYHGRDGSSPSSSSGYLYSDRRNGYGGSGNVPDSGLVGHASALSGSSNHESEKQWEWLEEVLAKSSRNKETVYIVGHIPPGSDERHIGHTIPFGHSSFTEKNNARYLRLVKRYSSIIQGQFFGHLHSDSFRVVYNEVGKPVSWMMIAPSISPRRSSESNNPAMRLYKFDTDTGQVLDYTQYYLDLEQANLLEEAAWQPEYNLTTYYYGLSEVSAVALHNLADRFNNADDAQFMKYYRANSVRHATGTCEGVCLLNHYCAITRLDYRDFRTCLETAAKALASKNGSPGGPLRGSNTAPMLYRLVAVTTSTLLIQLLLTCGWRPLPAPVACWFSLLADTFINFVSFVASTVASTASSAIASAAVAATAAAAAAGATATAAAGTATMADTSSATAGSFMAFGHAHAGKTALTDLPLVSALSTGGTGVCLRGRCERQQRKDVVQRATMTMMAGDEQWAGMEPSHHRCTV
ncbi:acid sphingomyelinase-like phosphodiesterase 3a [Anopheles albimanus]|uniref:acid sphingomyelinase-like phosphodiesterase 3a n=1 Tax=Anopheles albimanus TaxID=7167 RepID=UPI00164190AB|nr:acid sphingomyelinase-like phosphodiesterase 3a [Anopheles albimanus]XP_035786019.1 acid sphingomyelinase-like phosphodiesterase 3a [Anopheles albimanus]XP_035786020.1 acid sphingomyelinase-like phosphodiesterase 3a [Anopheles albimanus]XP_035786021.1 acid sphingomyelinase-like phosphodiesterase 3a [Anopheles albimanus]XP_035786022.1 acid sphingomyelinase-like phosphodiesterase 3a [Anopheles albimanus]XP_035786023.1 acid sphingomyelinase-like phosphodiesterase 3a [Anopheles albimanus]XP_03